MKKFLAILATPIAGLLLVAAPAGAHTPQVVATCSGLSISLSNYEVGANGQNNSLTIGIDNQPPGGVNFGASYTHTFTWSQTAVHSWSVLIDANKVTGDPTAYDAVFTGTQQPCQVAPTTTSTPATTSTAPTTTVPTSTTVVVAPGVLSTTTVVSVGEPPVPCAYNVTLPADSPLCVPPSTVDPLPTVPVQTLSHSDVLPSTGSRADNGALIGLAVFTLGMAFTFIARRKRSA